MHALRSNPFPHSVPQFIRLGGCLSASVPSFPNPICAIGAICGFSSFSREKVQKTANGLCDFALENPLFALFCGLFFFRNSGSVGPRLKTQASGLSLLCVDSRMR